MRNRLCAALVLWIGQKAAASNVAINSNDIVVAVGEGFPGIMSRQLPDGPEQVYDLPRTFGTNTVPNIFKEVAMDPDDPTTVFVFGDRPESLLCLMKIGGRGSLTLRFCVEGFRYEPYSGIAARNGKLIISGGEDGLTYYDYDSGAATIEINPKFLEFDVDNVEMSPGVILVTPTLAAMSAQFALGGENPSDCEFGTKMVDLSGDAPEPGTAFCVANGIGSNFSFSFYNYGLRSDVYQMGDQTYMYTVNGPLTIQDPYSEDGASTVEISNPGISYLDVAVNQGRQYLILLAVDNLDKELTTQFHVEVHDISNPLSPVLALQVDQLGRLASIATFGEWVAYSTSDEAEDGSRTTTYGFFPLPTQAPTFSPAPTTPTETPTATPTASDVAPTPAPTPRRFLPVPSPSIQGSNVAITSNMVAVVVGAGLTGIISQQLPDGPENRFPLPYNVDVLTSVEDVAVDPDNPTLVFVLSNTEQFVCSFRIVEDASLRLVKCTTVDMGPYSGISAKDGVVVISGGESGYTAYEYNQTSGDLEEFNDRFQGVLLEGIASFPDALMLDRSTVALSAVFEDGNGSFEHGTSIMTVDTNIEQRRFLVANGFGDQYALTPSNFPLQSALYEFGGRTVMFTGNGPLTIQNPYVSDTEIEIVLEDFKVLMLAVNQQKKYLVLGGVNDRDEYSIEIYFIGNPESPFKFTEVVGLGRITSVATHGDYVAFTSTAVAGPLRATFYQVFEIPPMPPTEPPAPTSAPPTATYSPTDTEQPTESPAPTRAPTPTATPASSTSNFGIWVSGLLGTVCAFSVLFVL